jgi:hypothetical protein
MDSGDGLKQTNEPESVPKSEQLVIRIRLCRIDDNVVTQSGRCGLLEGWLIPSPWWEPGSLYASLQAIQSPLGTWQILCVPAVPTGLGREAEAVRQAAAEPCCSPHRLRKGGRGCEEGTCRALP